MKKIELNIYDFDELDEKVKKKILEKEIHSLYESLPTNFVTEDIKTVFEENGVVVTEINRSGIEWSLSNSQGDGVRITGKLSLKDIAPKITPSKKESWKKLLNAEKEKNVSAILSPSGRYAHKNSISLNIEIHDHDLADKLHKDMESITEDVLSHVIDVCGIAEKVGYETIGSLTSEEEVLRSLRDDRHFFKSGKEFTEWSEKD